MKWLPRYTKSDLQIYAVLMPFIVVLINSLLFEKRFFSDPKIFLLGGSAVLVIMTIIWFVFTWVAVTVRNRFTSNRDFKKRLIITILLIGIIQALVITLFFQGFSHFKIFDYELNEGRYYWSLAIGFMINIFITMLHEGFDSFERWRTTFSETEQLKTNYAQSQLLGLRSQVNPHFLFNSLNSLSSLINEDSDKAETFLNELTKVYRYLLRPQDEKLVTLGTELQFIRSYFYLLKTRYRNGVELRIEIGPEAENKYVTPFLLQTIFEYSFNSNAFLKDKPLVFLITVDAAGRLMIKNNVLAKKTNVPAGLTGINNLVEKYKLLSEEEVKIEKTDTFFSASIPLLTEPQILKYEIG